MKTPDSSEPKPSLLKDRVLPGGTGGSYEDLVKLGTKVPGLISTLERITDPVVTREVFFDAIGAFNETNMKKREGMYRTVSFESGVAVKYYENGSVSISGSYSYPYGVTE